MAQCVKRQALEEWWRRCSERGAEMPSECIAIAAEVQAEYGDFPEITARVLAMGERVERREGAGFAPRRTPPRSFAPAARTILGPADRQAGVEA